MSDKTDIKSMTLSELEVFTTEVMGEKKFLLDYTSYS